MAMPKIEPAVTELHFEVGAQPTGYIDISRVASIVNRRFYRQGLNWAIGGFKWNFARTVPTDSTVQCNTFMLPNTWVVGAAWQKAFSHWKRQQDETLADSLSMDTRARFRDFKIYADLGHTALGDNGMTPVNPGTVGTAANTAYLEGEWQYSQVVVPNDGGVVGDTNEYTLHMVGDNGVASKAIIFNYQLSRSFPFSPDPAIGTDVPHGSVFNQMFDVGMDSTEISENATDKNNDLPYDQDIYPGQTINAGEMPLHDSFQLSPTTLSGTRTMSGGVAPCGLIKYTHTGSGLNAYDIVLTVQLVPGEHRGYLAEPMARMN